MARFPWKDPTVKECPTCGTTRGLVGEARLCAWRVENLIDELKSTKATLKRTRMELRTVTLEADRCNWLINEMVQRAAEEE